MQAQAPIQPSFDRFLNCPKFGDTARSLSLKLLHALDQHGKHIALPFRSYSETFGQVLKRYLIAAQPVTPINTQYAFQFLKSEEKTKELVSESKSLDLYKEEIEDTDVIHFRIYPIQIHQMIQIEEELQSMIQVSSILYPELNVPANNITVVVQKPNNQTFNIVINRYSATKVLRLEICKAEHLQINQFKLLYAGKILSDDDTTLDDLGIDDGARIILGMKVHLGCFSPHSLIAIDQDRSIQVAELRKGDQVFSFSEERNRMEVDQVTSIHRTMLTNYLQIILDDQAKIECTPNHKFYSNGAWKSFSPEQSQRLKVGDSLTKSDLSAAKIVSITHINSPQPLQFFHISTLHHHTFIINGIISHNMELKFLNTADGREFIMNVTESETIEMLKMRLETELHVSRHQLLIVLNKKQLKNNESISDYIQDIKNCNYIEVIQHEQHTIVVNRLKIKREYRFKLNKEQTVKELKAEIQAAAEISRDHIILILNNTEMLNSQKIGEFELHKNFNRVNLIELEEKQLSMSLLARSNLEQRKMLYVRIEGNDYLRLNYNSLKQMRVQQFIASFIHNSKKCYSLHFGEVFLAPTDLLKEIQTYAIFNNDEINCYVVKWHDRLSFFNTLNFKEKFNILTLEFEPATIMAYRAKDAEIRQKLAATDFIHALNVKFNEQLVEFYQPIQAFTNPKSDAILQTFLDKFAITQAPQFSHLKGYIFCSTLVNSLLAIPPYIGFTHRVIPNIRFKEIYQKRGDTFYIQSFLSTHAAPQSINVAGQRNFTLMHIQSLTGRHIGPISNVNDEVVFLPFTYFYVKKIVIGSDFDEVWLVQVPAPLSFEKDVFMWVDDEPNSKQNIGICGLIDFSRFELVQMTCTEIAQYWMNEFGAVVKWKGRKIKVMSDMNRAEGPNDAMVGEAGINLVESFHNNLGYTTPIFIYCKNVPVARKAMQTRNIAPGRILKITNDQFALLAFLASE